VLNNVKCKIIEAAKAPDTGDQQSDVSQIRLLGDQNPRSHQASHKEQKSFRDDDATTFQISEHHNMILNKHSPKANKTTQHESIGDLAIFTRGQIAALSLLDASLNPAILIKRK
jgi:hypothetical protein